MYLQLRWVFIAVHGLSLVAASRGYTLLPVHRLPAAVASLVARRRLQGAPASAAVANRLGCSAACGIFLDQGSNLVSLHWLSHFSCVQLCATLWTAACQTSLSMGLPCPPPGDLLGLGIKPASLASTCLAGGFLTTGPQRKFIAAAFLLRLIAYGEWCWIHDLQRRIFSFGTRDQA